MTSPVLQPFGGNPVLAAFALQLGVRTEGIVLLCTRTGGGARGNVGFNPPVKLSQLPKASNRVLPSCTVRKKLFKIETRKKSKVITHILKNTPERTSTSQGAGRNSPRNKSPLKYYSGNTKSPNYSGDSKFTMVYKKKAVDRYLKVGSLCASRELGIHRSTFRKWYHKFVANGIIPERLGKQLKHYSTPFKLNVIARGRALGSIQASAECGVPSGTIRGWIRRFKATGLTTGLTTSSPLTKKKLTPLPSPESHDEADDLSAISALQILNQKKCTKANKKKYIRKQNMSVGLVDQEKNMYLVENIVHNEWWFESQNVLCLKVKWENWHEKFNTWESLVKLLEDCPDAVEDFFDNLSLGLNGTKKVLEFYDKVLNGQIHTSTEEDQQDCNTSPSTPKSPAGTGDQTDKVNTPKRGRPPKVKATRLSTILDDSTETSTSSSPKLRKAREQRSPTKTKSFANQQPVLPTLSTDGERVPDYQLVKTGTPLPYDSTKIIKLINLRGEAIPCLPAEHFEKENSLPLVEILGVLDLPAIGSKAYWVQGEAGVSKKLIFHDVAKKCIPEVLEAYTKKSDMNTLEGNKAS